MNFLKRQRQSSNQLHFYSHQVSQLAYNNTLIMEQLTSLFQEKKIIIKLISDAEKNQQNSPFTENDKRLRRCDKDIDKKHRCLEQGCQKSYGSEGSLLQHNRLKHPKVNSHNPPLMLDPA